MNEAGWRPAELAEIQNHLTNKSWTEIDDFESQGSNATQQPCIGLRMIKIKIKIKIRF